MTEHRVTRAAAVSFETFAVSHRVSRVAIVPFETFPVQHRISRVSLVYFRTLEESAAQTAGPVFTPTGN